MSDEIDVLEGIDLAPEEPIPGLPVAERPLIVIDEPPAEPTDAQPGEKEA